MATEAITSAVVLLVNARRRSYDLHGLKVSKALCRAAQKHADDMAKRNYFSHDTKDGPTWSQRLKKIYGDHTIGENIAYGQDDPREVMEAWMHSPPHRHNILHDGYSEIGIGFCLNGNFWVQDFGDRD